MEDLYSQQPFFVDEFTSFRNNPYIQQQLERNVIHQTRSGNRRDVRIWFRLISREAVSFSSCRSDRNTRLAHEVPNGFHGFQLHLKYVTKNRFIRKILGRFVVCFKCWKRLKSSSDSPFGFVFWIWIMENVTNRTRCMCFIVVNVERMKMVGTVQDQNGTGLWGRGKPCFRLSSKETLGFRGGAFWFIPGATPT